MPNSHSDTTFDAVVVGAGVIGCAIALELARSGRSVVVVDSRGAPGLGSTSASSAIVRYHYSHLPESALAWESGHRYWEWERHLGVVDPTGMAQFIQSGALVLEGPGYDLPRMVGILHELGIEVEELSGAEIVERFPAVDAQRFGPPARPEDDSFWDDAKGEIAGFYVDCAGHVDDPQLAAHNLAHAATMHGVQFLFGVDVVEVLRADGRVAGVGLADGARVVAPVVVNAAGPWSSVLNAMADVLSDFTMSTRPFEDEVISMPAPEGFRIGTGTCITDPDVGTYFRPHAGDTIIVGGIEPDCDPLTFLERVEDASESVTQETWEVQSLRLSRRVPSVSIPGRVSGIVGVYDVTDDWTPVYDRTCLDGYYVAIGTSGHGFKQAPFVGVLMATLIDRVEAGHDHDADPLVVRGAWTGVEVDLGHFSRLRTVVPQRGMG